MNFIKFYPDMKQPALFNTNVSIVNVIVLIQLLKILSDVVIRSILHVITSYVLMTMFQYILLSLITVWYIEFLPKLELKQLHVSILQFVSEICN